MVERPNEDVPLFSKRMLEGEYVAWNLVWTRDYGVAVNLDGVLVDNFGNCYITDVTANNSYYRTFGGVETNTANYMYQIVRLPFTLEAFSVTRKYVLGEDLGVFQQMDIWRDGVLIASIDLFIDNADDRSIEAMDMSPNGKFLAFVIESLASLNGRYVMLYEGI